MLAARAGNAEVVHKLCVKGDKVAGVGRRDRRGRDAVMEAAAGGHDTVVQILLTFAPSVSTPGQPTAKGVVVTGTDTHEDAQSALLSHADNAGNTALHFASSNGHLLVLRTLLAAGANYERKNVWDWTAVSYSATVAAEVYFRNLVGEVERKSKVRREALETEKAAGVRLVGGD